MLGFQPTIGFKEGIGKMWEWIAGGLAMKVLVTGGAGFIGRNFIEHILLNDAGIEIINIDKCSYAEQCYCQPAPRDV